MSKAKGEPAGRTGINTKSSKYTPQNNSQHKIICMQIQLLGTPQRFFVVVGGRSRGILGNI